MCISRNKKSLKSYLSKLMWLKESFTLFNKQVEDIKEREGNVKFVNKEQLIKTMAEIKGKNVFCTQVNNWLQVNYVG